MEYQVLARKFRPQNFEEIVGQDHIRTILQNAVIHNNIAHAYLFSGTRGVGKTTAARIFAKAIMCNNRDSRGNPCLKCDSCIQVTSGSSMDYLEIDGASNNSVENIRELIDNVQYLPTSGKYKVYVIDEVHMLSTSAFNALLKTLEEPPAHVVFIFATTDSHKLLDTVISRCQRVEFKNLSHEELKGLVQNIAQKEGIKFESEDVLEALCDHGNGSGRDVLSVLELLKNINMNKLITYSELSNVLGIPEKSVVNAFLKALLQADIGKVNSLYDGVLNGPIDLIKFHTHLQKMYFKLLEDITLGKSSVDLGELSLSAFSVAELVWIYEVMSKDFGWIETSTMLEQNLKLLYIKLTLRQQILSSENISNVEVKKKDKFESEAIIAPVDTQVETVSDASLKTVSETVTEMISDLEIGPDSTSVSELIVASEIEESDIDIEEDEELELSTEFYYQDFIEDLFQINNTIAANLERGNLLEEASIQNGRLNITIGFSEEEKIFYDVINESETKKKLRDIICSTYAVSEEGLNIQVKLLTNAEIDRKNFKSKIEIDEQNIVRNKEEQRERLLNNAFIRNAEELFESKVNKIILND